jgi:hypothetical protein
MRVALLVALLGLTASIAKAANDWVNILVQDPTGGLVANHLCYSTNGHDLSCDGGAPTITSGTHTAKQHCVSGVSLDSVTPISCKIAALKYISLSYLSLRYAAIIAPK